MVPPEGWRNAGELSHRALGVTLRQHPVNVLIDLAQATLLLLPVTG